MAGCLLQMPDILSQLEVNKIIIAYEYREASPEERVAMVLQHGVWLEQMRQIHSGEIDDPRYPERYTRDCESCEHKDKRIVGGMGGDDPEHGCGYYCSPSGYFIRRA